MPAAKNIIAGLGTIGILAAGAFLGGTKDGETEPTDGGIVAPVVVRAGHMEPKSTIERRD